MSHSLGNRSLHTDARPTLLEHPSVATSPRWKQVSAEHGEELLRASRSRISGSPKTEETRKWLGDALECMFVGSHLDQIALYTVVDACRARHAQENDVIIQQGEEVAMQDAGLYILDSGTLSVYKNEGDETPPGTCIKKLCSRGDVVGELAVLYNTRRAATVKVDCPSVVWSVDRGTFLAAKRESAERRFQTYTDLLGEIELLSSLSKHDFAKVVDALQPVEFNQGDIIIQQGEKGDTFYLLLEGHAIAKKDGHVVANYGNNSFFGELALLHDQPRAAEVSAATSCSCAALDRESFVRLVGPLESVQAHAEVAYRNHEAHMESSDEDYDRKAESTWHAGNSKYATPELRSRHVGSHISQHHGSRAHSYHDDSGQMQQSTSNGGYVRNGRGPANQSNSTSSQQRSVRAQSQIEVAEECRDGRMDHSNHQQDVSDEGGVDDESLVLVDGTWHPVTIASKEPRLSQPPSVSKHSTDLQQGSKSYETEVKVGGKWYPRTSAPANTQETQESSSLKNAGGGWYARTSVPANTQEMRKSYKGPDADGSDDEHDPASAFQPELQQRSRTVRDIDYDVNLADGDVLKGALKRMRHPCDEQWMVLDMLPRRQSVEHKILPPVTYIKKFLPRMPAGCCGLEIGDALVAINEVHVEFQDREGVEAVWREQTRYGEDLDLLFKRS